MKIAFAILLGLLMVPASVAQTSTGASQPSRLAAQNTARRFYQTYLKLKVFGLPDDKQLRALSPFLTDDLIQLFEKAKQTQAQFVKEHPDEKGPWADGDLFTSLFEGAQKFQLGSVSMNGVRAEVPVNLSYHQGGATSRWTDVLVLTWTKDGWRVSDILMKGEWQFKNGESLRSILKADNFVACGFIVE